MNARVEAVMDYMNQEASKSPSILDIGCVQHDLDRVDESTWLHGRLDAAFDDVTGLDYAEEQVAELNRQGYDVVHADAETFNLSNTYDIIVAGELIEHLANPGKFLERAREHLKASGMLLLTTPNPWYFGYFFQATRGDVLSNPEHTCWFDKRTLRQLLSRYDFEVEHFEYVTGSRWSLLYPHRWIETKIMRSVHGAGFKTIGSDRMLCVARMSDSE